MARPSDISLGPFTLARELGRGGMAVVHEVTVPGNDTTYALKRPLPQLATCRDALAVFRDEARLAEAVSCQTLPQVFQVGLDRWPYILMEVLRGTSLESHRGIPMEIDTLTWVASHLAEAVTEIHEASCNGAALNIIHRDLTPSNILLQSDGRLRVLDLGVAKSSIQTSETMPGGVKGKYGYLSPEQCLGLDVDQRSDLFSVGVILFELATGVAPFHKRDNDTPYLIMQRIADADIDPTPLRKRAPHALASIILKLLAKTPEQRYKSARHLWQDLAPLPAHKPIALPSKRQMQLAKTPCTALRKRCA